MQHHYEGHWKGWALKIETFLGPEMARAKRVPFGPKKVNAPHNDVAPLKIITYRAIKTTGTLVVLCTRVLLCRVVVCCCVLLCVVVCKRGGEVSLQLSCVRRYSGGGGWLAGLTLPL